MLEARYVRVDEQVDKLREGELRAPVQALPRLGRVSHEVVQLGGASLEGRVDANVVLPVEVDALEGSSD